MTGLSIGSSLTAPNLLPVDVSRLDGQTTATEAPSLEQLGRIGTDMDLTAYVAAHPEARSELESVLVRSGRYDALFQLAQSTPAQTPPSAAPAAAPAPPAGAAPAPVTADQIRQIMPNAGDQADVYADALNTAMAAHGVTTTEQRAAFLAQISVESGDLRNTSENLDYSAHRLTQVWPRRFPTLAAAQPYAHNPQALANNVYAGRLGNGDAASGDGFTYRGRGLMQVTGRDNYRAAGFETNPEALADPQTAADTAANFWQSNGLDARTQGALNRAQFDAITTTVNGGKTGSDARWAAYQRALTALQAPAATMQGPAH